MKLIDATCPHCGAVLKIDPSRKNAVCEHCGAVLLIDDEVQHIEYDNAEEAGYKFEKGRQRAQAEARRKAAYEQQTYYDQSQSYEPPKKRHTLLWVLGWLVIFPLPLTILLVRNKRMNGWLRAFLILAAWVAYGVIMFSGESASTSTANSPQKAAVATLAPKVSAKPKKDSESFLNTPIVSVSEQIAEMDAFYQEFSESGTYENLQELVEKHKLHCTSGAQYDAAKSIESYSVYIQQDIREFMAGGNEDHEYTRYFIDIDFDLSQNKQIVKINYHTPKDDDHYAPTLNGRGKADFGGEPNYLHVIGYAALSSSSRQALNLEKTDAFQDESLWAVPTYEKDKQFWSVSGSLPHKTEVIVRGQELKHTGYGYYDGYLLVEKKDDGSQYYISVKDFTTKPYWTYQDNLKEAAKTGFFVAEYNQVSDYYPVDSSWDKLDLPNGTLVLVTGLTGTSSKYRANETELEAIVWKEWRVSYGGVKCHFNSEDLRIVY